MHEQWLGSVVEQVIKSSGIEESNNNAAVDEEWVKIDTDMASGKVAGFERKKLLAATTPTKSGDRSDAEDTSGGEDDAAADEKKGDEQQSIAIRVETTVDAPVAALVRFVWSIGQRKRWDLLFSGESHALKQLDSLTRTWHLLCPVDIPFVDDRDFVVIEHCSLQKDESLGAVVFCSHSTSEIEEEQLSDAYDDNNNIRSNNEINEQSSTLTHISFKSKLRRRRGAETTEKSKKKKLDSARKRRQATRGFAYSSGIVISALPNSQHSSNVTYLLDLDLRGHLPSSVASRIVSELAISSLFNLSGIFSAGWTSSSIASGRLLLVGSESTWKGLGGGGVGQRRRRRRRSSKSLKERKQQLQQQQQQQDQQQKSSADDSNNNSNNAEIANGKKRVDLHDDADEGGIGTPPVLEGHNWRPRNKSQVVVVSPDSEGKDENLSDLIFSFLAPPPSPPRVHEMARGNPEQNGESGGKQQQEQKGNLEDESDDDDGFLVWSSDFTTSPSSSSSSSSSSIALFDSSDDAHSDTAANKKWDSSSDSDVPAKSKDKNSKTGEQEKAKPKKKVSLFSQLSALVEEFSSMQDVAEVYEPGDDVVKIGGGDSDTDHTKAEHHSDSDTKQNAPAPVPVPAAAPPSDSKGSHDEKPPHHPHHHKTTEPSSPDKEDVLVVFEAVKLDPVISARIARNNNQESKNKIPVTATEIVDILLLALHLRRRKEVKILGELARGAGSTLYEGILPGGETKVAVKKPRITGADVIQRFFREADILSKVSHPNIVSLLAVSKTAPDYAFCLELCPRGSLEDVIHVEGIRFSWNSMRHIAIQLASALNYLHSHSILHRDLKSSNVLVRGGADGDASWHVLVSDFDTAEYEAESQQQELESGKTRKNRTVGSLVTMAPEILKNTGVGQRASFVFSKASDVYSLGVTLNEVCAGTMPYSDRFTSKVNMHTVLNINYSKHTLAAAIIRENLRPVLATACPQQFRDIIELCWQDDVARRPACADLVSQLEATEEGDFGTASPPAKKGGAIGASIGAPLATNYFLKSDNPSPNQSELAGALQEAHDELKNARGPFWIFLENMARQGKLEGFPAPSSDYKPTVTAGAFETCGRRGAEGMEDAHAIVLNVGGRDDQHLIACFDGHGGPWAARFASEFVPLQVIHSWSSVDSPPAAIIEAFLRTDETFAAFGDERCGTTALAVFVSGHRLIVCNAGDCRAVLCKGGDAVQLSRDHTAKDERERERVVAAGGTIDETADGPRVNGQIRVTRALGDKAFKPAVIPQPEVMMLELEEDDEFVVVACDGVFDVLSNKDVVKIVQDTVKEPSLAAKRIVMEAYQRNADDNMTALVMFLRPVTTFERVL